MDSARRRLALPRLQYVQLDRLTLYSLQPTIEVPMPNGVFCLVGANGLGKSTFLSAVNFGFTGRVAEPDRKFESVREHYHERLFYSERFFDGRVEGDDQEVAAVTLRFTVGRCTYALTRGMFEPRALRHLSVWADGTTPDATPSLDGTNLDPEDRQSEYEASLTRDVGVPTFEHFVFMQHFVLTFDEQRRLLLWDEDLIETALFLAFGVDNEDVTRAGMLRRQIDGHWSRARNLRWEASRVKGRLRDLERAIATVGGQADDIVAQHQTLQKRVTESQDRARQLMAAQRDQERQLGMTAATASSLRASYEETFARMASHSPPVERHPLVVSSLAARTCQLCGAEGKAVVSRIRDRSHGEMCPLCGSVSEPSEPVPALLGELQRIESSLAELAQTLEEGEREAARIDQRLAASQSELDAAARELAAFEDARAPDLVVLGSGGQDGVEGVTRLYREQIAKLNGEADEEYRRRDQRRKEMASLQRRLETRWASAERAFVPSFRELAGEFLGLALDIHLQRSESSTRIGLEIEVSGTRRRSRDQVSESQRLFLDIALRMALVEFMSDPEHKGCLYVDTPEGSLDIAYESRAGAMFAEFAHRGFGLLMTANINTSALLLRLAERCGSQGMQLGRMTDWAELSDVQRDEEDRINEAFRQIEERLLSGSAG